MVLGWLIWTLKCDGVRESKMVRYETTGDVCLRQMHRTVYAAWMR